MMQMTIDRSTSKRHTNLTLSSDVLAEAKQLGINISKVCDEFLRELVRQEKERLWKANHAEFISAYNKSVEDEGLPLEQWKTF